MGGPEALSCDCNCITGRRELFEYTNTADRWACAYNVSSCILVDRPQWWILGLRMGEGGGDKFQSQLRASGFKLQTVEVAVRFKMNALPIMLLLSIHVHAVYWSNKQCGYVSIPSISGLTTSGP